MIRLEQVSQRYDGGGGTVLHEVSFAVEAGGFRWLVGPSGAGKSTLLRLLTLAERPCEGRLHLFGIEASALPRRRLPRLRRRIGAVWQDFRLLPQLSVYDNVALPLRLRGLAERRIAVDVGEMLRWVGLARRHEVLPATLSGGEQQRCAIARAVVGRPELLLADEPTGNLDPVQAERLMQLLAELNRVGTTVIVATHDGGLVARHPAPALRLTGGRLDG